MRDKYILTAESVTAGHPDKLCDTIADSILDTCLKEDPNARVACEVLATAGKILVAGELRTTASPDVEAIVRQTVRNAGYDCNYHVEVRLHTQSPDIADAVDGETLGAGDQGIMYGYACWETVELLPAPVVLANRITSLLTTCREENLISGIGPDGKAQVSVQYAFGVPEREDAIVISCQHDADKDPDELREELRRLVIARACHDVRIDEQTKILINPSGRFVLGGFEASLCAVSHASGQHNHLVITVTFAVLLMFKCQYGTGNQRLPELVTEVGSPVRCLDQNLFRSLV